MQNASAYSQSIVQSLPSHVRFAAVTGMLFSKTTILKQIDRWLERSRPKAQSGKLVPEFIRCLPTSPKGIHVAVARDAIPL